MDTKELAERILDQLGDHAMQAMTRPMDRDGLSDLHKERVSIVARLIEADRPTVPLPGARDHSTDPYRTSIRIVTKTMIFMVESVLDGNKSPADVDRHNEKFRAKIEDDLRDFKRATREEAMAEFTEGASAADNLMEGTIGKRHE